MYPNTLTVCETYGFSNKTEPLLLGECIGLNIGLVPFPGVQNRATGLDIT